MTNLQKTSIQNAKEWISENIPDNLGTLITSNSIQNGQLLDGFMIAVIVPAKNKNKYRSILSEYGKIDKAIRLFPISHIETDDIEGDLKEGVYI